MKAVVVLALVIGAVVGGYFMFLKPPVYPEMTFKNGDDGSITMSEIRESKEALLMVFLMDDPMSKMVIKIVEGAIEGKENSIETVGLYFGTLPGADKMENDLQVSFPIYSLRDTPDPIAVNEFYELGDASIGLRNGYYSGTIILLDETNALLLMLDPKEAKEFPERLAGLGF